MEKSRNALTEKLIKVFVYIILGFKVKIFLFLNIFMIEKLQVLVNIILDFKVKI